MFTGSTILMLGAYSQLSNLNGTHQTMLAEYLFVYGTLKQEAQDNNYALIEPFTEFLAHASAYGNLYLYEDATFIYPGFVYNENSNTIVQGELYVITDAPTLFQVLDQYEGCDGSQSQPYQYRREQVTVKSNVAFEYQAWTYIYNWPVAELKEIESGNFI
jgi:gamma-glutamylcyclotransferase (GGCT)/AIG2-like uncharacterized protein YtfP